MSKEKEQCDLAPKDWIGVAGYGIRLFFDFLKYFFRDVWTCRIYAALAAIWFTSKTLVEHAQEIGNLVNLFK